MGADQNPRQNCCGEVVGTRLSERAGYLPIRQVEPVGSSEPVVSPAAAVTDSGALHTCRLGVTDWFLTRDPQYHELMLYQLSYGHHEGQLCATSVAEFHHAFRSLRLERSSRDPCGRSAERMQRCRVSSTLRPHAPGDYSAHSRHSMSVARRSFR